jgi:hypothetical protein
MLLAVFALYSCREPAVKLSHSKTFLQSKPVELAHDQVLTVNFSGKGKFERVVVRLTLS